MKFSTVGTALEIVSKAWKVLEAVRERAQTSKDAVLKDNISKLYDEFFALKSIILRLTDENAALGSVLLVRCWSRVWDTIKSAGLVAELAYAGPCLSASAWDA